MPSLFTNKEGQRVTQDLPEHSTRQVPEVFSPHPLYRVTLGELSKNGIYAVAQLAQKGAPTRGGVLGLVRVWSHQLKTSLSQLLGRARRVVVVVSNDDATAAFHQITEHPEFMDVGGGYREARDHTGPRHPGVQPESVEGLSEQGVPAKSSLPKKTPAPGGAGEQTRWQGKGIPQCKAIIVRGPGEQALPDALFGLPEIGGLPYELTKVVRWRDLRAGKK